MKKYIEIIFDDSGSMNETVNGEPKHITAKRIIKEQIIPKLDFKNSEVYLRTLSQDCKIGFSKVIKLSGTIQRINNEIDNIFCTKSTPLYYTIKDSIDACKNSGFSESHIFILTDGDDTCSASPEQILGNDFLKIKNQLNLNTILVQFVIESDITKNNLTALGQKIGATNVVINTKDLKNIKVLDQKLSKSFIKSGLNKAIPFPHCQVEMKNDISMAELTEYDFYLVQLLYQEKFLSWKPTLKKKLNSEQRKNKMGDIVNLVNKYGFPIVMAVGMGFIIKYVWTWATTEIKPVINDTNTVLIGLIDRIRMLDQDLIRLNQKVNTVLHLRGKTIEYERVEAESEINKQVIKNSTDNKGDCGK
jgi:hypothetical protein